MSDVIASYKSAKCVSVILIILYFYCVNILYRLLPLARRKLPTEPALVSAPLARGPSFPFTREGLVTSFSFGAVK